MWDTFIHKYLKWPYTLNYRIYNNPPHASHTIVMIHGIGSSSRMWEKIAAKCAPDARVIAIDLLGFGNSPKPSWKVYNVKTHVDSLVTTLLTLGVSGPVIVVGHSLGSLVSVEFAKRYPMMVRELILCSPPFYRANDRSRRFGVDETLRALYKTVHDNPQNAKLILETASKYNYLNAGFKVDDTNLATYLATLEASIINQTSLYDAIKLKRPITIIVGSFDIFVIIKNLKYLQKEKPGTVLKTVAAGHEINLIFSRQIISALRAASERVA